MCPGFAKFASTSLGLNTVITSATVIAVGLLSVWENRSDRNDKFNLLGGEFRALDGKVQALAADISRIDKKVDRIDKKVDRTDQKVDLLVMFDSAITRDVTPLTRRNHGRSLYIATPNGDPHRQTID